MRTSIIGNLVMSKDKNIHCENDNLEKKEEAEAIDNKEQKDLSIELTEQISVLKDALLRKTAEMENTRKRLEKEKEEAIKYSNKSFAKDLLSVLDNFERINMGFDSLKEKVEKDSNLKAYFDGISLCEKELLSTFKKYGISKIEVSEGDNFNHEYHQAMCEVEDKNHPAGSIVKILQTGYRYNDRLLRPTMVSVSKK